MPLWSCILSVELCTGSDPALWVQNCSGSGAICWVGPAHDSRVGSISQTQWAVWAPDVGSDLTCTSGTRALEQTQNVLLEPAGGSGSFVQSWTWCAEFDLAHDSRASARGQTRSPVPDPVCRVRPQAHLACCPGSSLGSRFGFLAAATCSLQWKIYFSFRVPFNTKVCTIHRGMLYVKQYNINLESFRMQLERDRIPQLTQPPTALPSRSRKRRSDNSIWGGGETFGKPKWKVVCSWHHLNLFCDISRLRLWWCN